MHPDMKEIRCTILRGGTSKGIYILDNELPKEPELRKRVIQAVFGSPDLRQIDGLGGADTLTSKLAIIAPSSREDADVEYTFAQVGIDKDVVDFGGNCGNISSGVGPFAIDAGLVAAVEPVTTVRIYQTNTDRILKAEVPVKDGKARTAGEFHIDGVPGSGAKITMDFSTTAGSATGKLLPTGRPVDTLKVKDREYQVSIVDAGNPLVFIAAESLGLQGNESAAGIDGDPALLQRIEDIRSRAAVLIGMGETPEEVTKNSPYAPFFAIVSAPQAYVTPAGGNVAAEDVDLVSRLLFMQKMHKTYPGTGAVCTAAAIRIPDSIPYEKLRREADGRQVVHIGHPAGVMDVGSIAHMEGGETIVDKLAFYRTARKIMDGIVYVPNAVFAEKGK